jgi:cullin-4
MIESFYLSCDSVKPQLPATFEEDSWNKLGNAVKSIHKNQLVSDGLEDLYKACENLCSYKMGHSLYIKLQKECEFHIREEAQRLLE